MPIANYLHHQGIDVYICANGAALTLMKMECYYAKFVDDVPFEISYGNNRTSNILKLIGQLPKMWKQLYDEHQLLKKIVSQHNIDLVISDHRYGFYHTVVPSIFVTHQLNIKAPFGQRFVNFLNHYFIKKFSACWVPDFEENEHALAGELSRNHELKNVSYIGPLSRGSSTKNITDKNAPILYLLSGVEPQRSLFEKLIIQHHNQYPHKAILIRGTNQSNEMIEPKNNLIVYDICDARQLQSLVSACRYVVCRSGYSSIMDLMQWQKNAVLVPTPGQTEQEYLAKYLSQKKWFYCINQNDFLHFKEDAMQTYACPNNLSQTSNYQTFLNNLI